MPRTERTEPFNLANEMRKVLNPWIDNIPSEKFSAPTMVQQVLWTSDLYRMLNQRQEFHPRYPPADVLEAHVQRENPKYKMYGVLRRDGISVASVLRPSDLDWYEKLQAGAYRRPITNEPSDVDNLATAEVTGTKQKQEEDLGKNNKRIVIDKRLR